MIDKSCEACQKTTLASSFHPCFESGGKLNCACECHDVKAQEQNTRPTHAPDADLVSRARAFLDARDPSWQTTLNPFVDTLLGLMAAFTESEIGVLREILARLVAYYADVSLICGNCDGRGYHLENPKCERCGGTGNFNNPHLLDEARAALDAFSHPNSDA